MEPSSSSCPKGNCTGTLQVVLETSKVDICKCDVCDYEQRTDGSGYSLEQPQEHKPMILKSMINKARFFAIEAHKDTRYGKLPYEYHLHAVFKIMGSCSNEGLAAAFLHDVVEDTPVTLHDVRERFGGKVARLVDCVTDEPGANRKERKSGMYKKLAAGPPLARRLKLADRIANMEASIENPKLAVMYAKEFPEFIRIVGIDEENNDLILRVFRLFAASVEAGAFDIPGKPGWVPCTEDA